MSNYTYRNAEDLAERAVDYSTIHWDAIIAQGDMHRDNLLSAMVDVGYARCMIATDWPVASETFRDVLDSLQEYVDSFH